MSSIYPSDTPSDRPWRVQEAIDRGVARIEDRPWAVAAVYIFLSAVVLFPVFSVTVPPLVDYPNHLARAHILSAWETTPALQQNYIPVHTIRPNMAMDLIVPALTPFMSIYLAGKVFIAMTLLSLIGGILVLRKVFAGRIDLWPVLAFLLLYNWAFFWGFLNYLFTAGLALIAFGAWIALRDRPIAVRLPVFCSAAFLLYVGHLFGLLVYGLLVAGYEIWRLRERRPTLRRMFADNWVNALQFVLPAVLFIAWVGSNATDDPVRTEYGQLIFKLAALVSPTKFGMPVIDILVLAFIAFVLLRLRASKIVGIAGPVKIPLLMLAVVALAMPNYLMGVWGTDIRLPTIILCVLVAALQFAPNGTAIRAPFIAIASILVLVRAVAVSDYWVDIDRDFEEFRSASDAIDPGAKLLVVGDESDLPASKWPGYRNHYGHLASLAVIERSVFLPSIFTDFTSVAVQDGLRRIDSPVAGPISRELLHWGEAPAAERPPLGYRLSRYSWVYWSGWPEQFDYALVVRFGNMDNPSPDHLAPIASRANFDIHRVVEK